MRVLFIGGTWVISSACSALALEQGINLTLINRGYSDQRPGLAGARVLTADVRDAAAVAEALRGDTFDVVVDWIAFTADHAAADLAMFRGRVGQYVFISSAAAYRKPPPRLPITEDTPLDNPYWPYARHKIAAEALLTAAARDEAFPLTIVRPSHTYDATLPPFRGRFTILDRLRRGKPLVVHGDGTSLWTLTHHRDFARGFLPLLGEGRAIAQAFHITSDEVLTWNEIAALLGEATGVAPVVSHVPPDTVARYDADWGASLLGDKAHDAVFDNSKIRAIVPGFAAEIPFATGAGQIFTWYDAHPTAQIVDPEFDALLDRLAANA